MHPDIYIANQEFRNKQRLADYKARKEEFINQYCCAPDPDYAAYYGADMAAWIDAVQTFDVVKHDKKEWWEYQEEDEEWINQQEINFIKRQAF